MLGELSRPKYRSWREERKNRGGPGGFDIVGANRLPSLVMVGTSVHSSWIFASSTLDRNDGSSAGDTFCDAAEKVRGSSVFAGGAR